jgi:hypothetical protein
MNTKQEPWELEARRKQDARDRLSDRDGVASGITQAEAKAKGAATQAEWNARAKPTLNDAARALQDTASLSPNHPDRVAAVKAYDEARARGDSFDVRADSVRVDRTDSSGWYAVPPGWTPEGWAEQEEAARRLHQHRADAAKICRRPRSK